MAMNLESQLLFLEIMKSAVLPVIFVPRLSTSCSLEYRV